jgi:DNA-binding XRE family transcriptional regulator
MLGSQLKQIRKAYDYTQKELAQELGVSRQALCMWEKDKREIKLGILYKIAMIFDVSINDLLMGNPLSTVQKEKGKMKRKMSQKAKSSTNVKSTKGSNMKSQSKMGSTAATRKKRIKTAQKNKIKFELSAPHAQSVFVSGDFNGWDTQSHQMKKTKRGVWKTDLQVEPGRYEYKFLVDDEWWTDPNNTNMVWNTVGSQNSYFELN